jgi:glutathione peroxidase
MNAFSNSIYAFSAPLLDGTAQPLVHFKGQVLLIVNTASHCGFTPQFSALQDFYRAYQDRGFSVLAFPCNQFGGQEPGSELEIGLVCQKNYGVSFPVFKKIL